MILYGRDQRQEVHLSGLRGWLRPWLPLKALKCTSSFSTGLYDSTEYVGIFLGLDRDHDYPDLVRSVCPNGHNGASIPIVASCRFWFSGLCACNPGAVNPAAGTADRNINSEANA